jgi:enoyl-[acyl-carrier protein] reductase III
MAFRTNAQALLLLAREALGWLAEPGGRIVALSSLGSHRYVPFYGAVGISKAALENVVRYLAVELAPRGIAVNAVSGGMIEGETLRAFPQYEAIRDAVLQRTPANRLGTAEDLADVVLFLLGNRARWIYGQTLIADGGFSLA